MNADIVRRSMLCLGLVAYFFSFVLRADGIVLCIGEDGHVELERAAPSMGCGSITPGQDASSLRVAIRGALDKGHCGECKDIPLALANSSKIIGAQIPAVFAQAPTVEIPLFTATHPNSYLLPILKGFPQETIPISSAQHFLASIRSVILLI